MLFNSYEFLVFFLPITLLTYYFVVIHISRTAAFSWLLFCSLFFYGWWNPVYLALFLPLLIVNFFLGQMIAGTGGTPPRSRKITLTLSISLNLGALAYFKYANFFADIATSISPMRFELDPIILPLAISFYTFQQIAYLVDCYKSGKSEPSLRNYMLFISFFPQLIAGPIVHHSEIMPQFAKNLLREKLGSNISVGLTLFALGLAKKCLIADSLAPYANDVFSAAGDGTPIDFVRAWQGALAYSFELYFDFSGYSDMAIGLARLFGFRLPANFNAPYKAKNIIDFWRRWHITLSRFLRDYLYIPMGGNRLGHMRRHMNLFITMVLGGLWHGANWTFMFWGALHGFYLVCNHGWRYLCTQAERRGLVLPSVPFVGPALTFLAVVVGWVFFRANSFETAIILLKGMAGQSGISLPNGIIASSVWLSDAVAWLNIATHDGGGREFLSLWSWIIVASVTAFFAPTSAEFLRRYRPLNQASPVQTGRLLWRPTVANATLTALLLLLSFLSLTQVSEFLYFQF